MPGENLTHAEAAKRAEIVSTSAYEIALDLTTGPELFRSRTTVRFEATEGASTFIDAITRTVHSVTLNGRALDPAIVADGSRIQLNDLAQENVLVVDADMIYMNTGEGLHRFVDPADGQVYLYSQFEVPDSRRMFTVFEQPDLKATFQFTVTAPADWKVISNQPTPQPTPAGEGIATWAFGPTPVMSSYITALIAGPYAEVRSELTSADGRTIPLGVFCRASLSEFLDADYIFDKTREGFEFFEAQFNYPYPFDKYDQLFVPEYNMGAMENIGAVTFTEAYVFRSKVTDAMRERRVVTILHELAHMWFGDLVTMRWWNDLWLNESFAEYVSTLATAEASEWKEAWTTFAVSEKAWAYRQDQLPSTHPIVATINDLQDVQVNFDGITYAKGASVLKQLVAWVGQEPFMAGVNKYFTKHAFGNTELPDLLLELEATSGRDLSEWSKLWLETAGVNTLRPEFTLNADGTYASFAIRQSAHPEYPTLRPHRIAIGCYQLEGEQLVRTHRVELDVEGELTEIPELISHTQPDLLLLNDDDLSYAKVRLDERSHATAQAHLSKLSPLARAVVWGSLWDATRDAETPARDFVTLVLDHIGQETESTTLRTVLGQLTLAASSYVDPVTKPATQLRVADALWQLAIDAEPGSDNQFQFIKVFAQQAHTEEHLDNVLAVLEERITLEGLDVDTDLGWELLIALAAGGRVSEEEIAAALEDDQTATGQQSAAHARAALPTHEAKARAWASVFDEAGAPNAIVRATGIGFLRAADPALLTPFVEQFFSALTRVWETRSYAIASELIEGFYPAPLVGAELREASEAWLTANPEPAALRRMVVESLAGVNRALAAQAADRS